MRYLAGNLWFKFNEPFLFNLLFSAPRDIYWVNTMTPQTSLISFFNNSFIFLNVDIKRRQVGFWYLHFTFIKKVTVNISSQWHV